MAVTCPDCGQVCHTDESMRVHRWIAHDIHEEAA
jgi:hypothetical protein